jgi:Uncharacterised nucleotidyltransferase
VAAVRDGTLGRAVDAVSVDVCRGRRPEVPDLPGIEDELVRAVRFHRIAPLAHVALRDVRPDLAALLRDDRDHALMHHVQVTTTLAAIGSTLADIPWLTFKGPVLSESLHPVPGLRTYTDLDILVAPTGLREAARRLFGTGWQVLATRDDLLNGEVTGEIELGQAGGAIVDLHWSLVLSETLRRRFHVPTDELLARSVPVVIGPVETRTLDATDTLVHLAHHAAFSDVIRLGHLLDVDQAARRIQDWDLVVRRAWSWGTGPQVGLVLARARRVLGTPVPPDLDRRLGLSRGVTALGFAVDRAQPVPALRKQSSWPRLLGRAARPGAVATATRIMQSAAMVAINRSRTSSPPKPFEPAARDDVESWVSAVEGVTGTASMTR